MTTVEPQTRPPSGEAGRVESALAMLWLRHLGSNTERVEIVEDVAAEIVRGHVTPEGREAGISAAHKLAGSLGTFGFEAGSRAALAVEAKLKDLSADTLDIAESVLELRDIFDQAVDSSNSGEDDANADHSQQQAPSEPANDRVRVGSDLVIISADPDLGARLTTEATAAGLTSTVIAPDTVERWLTPSDEADRQLPEMVVVDPYNLRGQDAAMLIRRLVPIVPVAVLAQVDTMAERMGLTGAGVSVVTLRSQTPAITIDSIGQAIQSQRIRRSGQADHWDIRILSGRRSVPLAVAEALPEEEYEVATTNELPQLWDWLESDGADLIVVDDGLSARSMADLCQVIRSNPNYRWTPIISIGSMKPAELQDAIAAGLDDQLLPTLESDAVRTALMSSLWRARENRAAATTDPLTGLNDRQATERALDRLLRLSNRAGEAFSFAHVAIRGFDQLKNGRGEVAGHLVIRRLAELFTQTAEPGQALGRWSESEIVLGFGRTSTAEAHDHVESTLRQLHGVDILGPNGESVDFDVAWHVASTPTDGTTLASLERVCLNEMERDLQVITIDRASVTAREMVDVVVVEDDDSVADVIAYALELRGYGSKRFVDGAAAAAALASGEVGGRVILLDVGLPSLDGFGVLQQLSSTGVLTSSHLIMLTARSSEAERLRALELGATEHIAKPFSVPVLLGRLDQVLGGRAR